MVAGRNRGVRLLGPGQEEVRPMLDRVKEAVFNTIQFEIPDASVLDVFAGTGSLGIEALSRGAKFVVFVEANPKVVDVLKKNISATKNTENAVVLHASIFDLLLGQQLTSRPSSDIVFLDPPYAMEDADKQRLLTLLIDNIALSPGALVIMHQERGRTVIEHPQLDIQKDKCYGTSQIIIYRWIGTPGVSSGDTLTGLLDAE